MRAASYTNHVDAPQILEQAIEAALRAAHQNDSRAIAIPAIGTGVFAFTPELSAEITAKVLSAASRVAPHLQCIRVCVASARITAPVFGLRPGFVRADAQDRSPRHPIRNARCRQSALFCRCRVPQAHKARLPTADLIVWGAKSHAQPMLPALS